jgi:hypothetical protein
MFKGVGKKLKIIAEIWCLLGILGSIAAGVLLFLGKMELYYCILIAIGGVFITILMSWGIYALGDIHVKLDRLEDKLIPKPNYMSYLNDNQALRGKCEICGKTTDLVNAKIVDKLGTRYRKVCKECYAANQCESAD